MIHQSLLASITAQATPEVAKIETTSAETEPQGENAPETAQPKASSNRASWYAVAALLAFGPLALGAVQWWSIAILEFLAFGAALLWILGCARRGELSFRSSPLIWSSLGFMAWVLAELVVGHTLDRSATSSSLLLFFCYFLTFVVVFNEEWSNRWVRRLALTMVGTGFVVALLGIIQYFTWNGKIYWFIPAGQTRPFGAYVNHNHFAGLMEMVTPLALGLVASRRLGRELRVFLVLVSVILGVATAISLSRAGAVSFIAGVCAFAFFYSKRHSQRGALLALFTFMIFVTLGLLYLGAEPFVKKMATLEHPTMEASYQDRMHVARDTLRLIRDHPLTGTGLGTYEFGIATYISDYTDKRWDKAHNDYLQLTAEVGLVGFGFAVWWIASLFRAFLAMTRDKSRQVSALRLGAFCGCFAVLIHSFVDFNLQIPANAMYFAVLAALVVRPVSSAEEPELVSGPSPKEPRNARSRRSRFPFLSRLANAGSGRRHHRHHHLSRR